MKRQIPLMQALGKTVLAINDFRHDDEVFIRFTDDTFVRLKADSCYDSVSLTDDDALRISEAYEMHVALGLVTQEEIDAYKRAESERCAAYREDRERAEYERLQKKFGGAA